MKQNFFDQLDGGWGEVVANTYKDANTFMAESTITPSGTVCIGKNKYNSDESVTGVLLFPDNVEVINVAAFRNCDGITRIEFPESLKGISTFAFESCTNLSKIKFNEGLEYLKSFAFSNCVNLKSVQFPSSLEKIGISVFENCGLEGNLLIPGNIKYLGNTSFANCKDLNGNLILEKGISEIDFECFMGCKFTGELYIPKTVFKIYGGAFYGCNFSTIYIKAENLRNWNSDWNEGCNAKIIYY